MACWQVSKSSGTSAIVRPAVGMASSTSTLMVPGGVGGRQQPEGLSRGGPSSPQLPASLPRRASRGAGPGSSPDTLVPGGWLLVENNDTVTHTSPKHVLSGCGQVCAPP